MIKHASEIFRLPSANQNNQLSSTIYLKENKTQTAVKLQCLVMLEESKQHQDGRSNIIKFHNNEFHTAITDEDLGRIKDMSKKYGSNFLIKIQGGAPREVFWKVNATMHPFLKNYL